MFPAINGRWPDSLAIPATELELGIYVAAGLGVQVDDRLDLYYLEQQSKHSLDYIVHHLPNKSIAMAPSAYNAPVPGLPFFTPQHANSPGSAKDANAKAPTLFTPLPIRGVTLRNRIIVAPMCQYSTAESGPQIGALTPYHVATLGHYALKGAGLVFIEATGVQANGRISPNCPGLWCEEQIAGVKAVADFVHSQGALCGIQLAHAGRKASTVAPFVAERFGRRSVRATKDVGGWPEDVVGPSGGQKFVWDGKAVEDDAGGYWPPRQLATGDIEEMVEDWKRAAERAVRAGVDVIEIHGGECYHISVS